MVLPPRYLYLALSLNYIVSWGTLDQLCSSCIQYYLGGESQGATLLLFVCKKYNLYDSTITYLLYLYSTRGTMPLFQLTNKIPSFEISH